MGTDSPWFGYADARNESPQMAGSWHAASRGRLRPEGLTSVMWLSPPSSTRVIAINPEGSPCGCAVWPLVPWEPGVVEVPPQPAEKRQPTMNAQMDRLPRNTPRNHLPAPKPGQGH